MIFNQCPWCISSRVDPNYNHSVQVSRICWSCIKDITQYVFKLPTYFLTVCVCPVPIQNVCTKMVMYGQKRGILLNGYVHTYVYIEQRAWSKAGNQFVYTLFSRSVCTPISCYYQVICSMLTVDVLLGVGSKVCS